MTSNAKKCNQIYSQNKLVNKTLIQRLVNQLSVTDGDLVYDIGAGSGTISEALLKRGARVIAIEKDKILFRECKQRFTGLENFEIHLTDFLKWEFPRGQRYKVFANIPFRHTADIIKKILSNKDPPEDCYLILQKEAAEKYAGFPNDTLASLLIKPMYWVDIIYHFKDRDFFPTPSVDIALLQIEKRSCQPIPSQYYQFYKDFIIFCREGPNRTVKKSLEPLLTYAQFKQLARTLRIDYQADPADLNFRQYLAIFQFCHEHNQKRLYLIKGSERRWQEQQASRIKSHRTSKRIRVG